MTLLYAWVGGWLWAIGLMLLANRRIPMGLLGLALGVFYTWVAIYQPLGGK